MDLTHAWDLITGKISTWFNEIVKLLPNILLAAVIIVIGIFIAKYVKKFATKVISKVSHNSTLNSLFGSIIKQLQLYLPARVC